MDQKKIILSRSDYDAVIFDLDGVVTRTAKVHFIAWKRLFDEYIEKHTKSDKWESFDNDDYLRYVDGKPRYEGVRSFLESRNIEIPYGNPEDEPGKETICGLGNLKNKYFNELIEKNGVEVYGPAVSLLRRLRSTGLKTAVVSSSKNCVAVLKSAQLIDLFDHKVDGVDARKMGLDGKPHPDIFLAAAEKLLVDPKRSVVLEDAISGVEAGKRGEFGMVIGVDRTGHADLLKRHGADNVISDLSAIELEGGFSSPADPIPSALKHFNEIFYRTENKEIAVFLDYDGTLTPIVKEPSDAILSDSIRDVLMEMSEQIPVAVISGRDRPDVQRLVGIEGIYYAGSHGFDIAAPDGTETGPEKGEDFLPALDRAEEELKERLEAVPGLKIERKKFSIAVHYRNVAEEDVSGVNRTVEEVKDIFPELSLSGGKKIFELQPAMDWHKGRALIWLIEKLGLDRSDVVPFYIGDDTTDEDAFRAIKNRGIGVVVMDSYRDSEAEYRLKNPDEVGRFLRKLVVLQKGGNR
ncbi:MAG: trehalose-phosphatase [Desulfatiglandaceae bacterium]